MPKPPNFLPKPPKLDDVLGIIDKAGDAIGKGVELIDRTAGRIDQLAGRLDPLSRRAPETTPETAQEPMVGASNETTLKYQLDHIIDDLEHLETEHLPYQGRLNGEPCDCIAKAARSLRRHAVETIPIAARQGEGAQIFSAMKDWAQHLIDIGTINQVVSGRYDDEYLAQAGDASNYRKQVEAIFTKVGTNPSDCPTCGEARESIKQFIEQRKEEHTSLSARDN
ncbi:hypothetical protein ES707_15676 [subsurface metagenome]